MLALYRLLWILITPVSVAWSIQQTLTRSGGLRYLLERLGIASINCSQTPVWFHAASIGEVRLASSLIESTLARGVLLTCNTPDAFRLATQAWGGRIDIRYCPIDYIWAVKRFLKAYKPLIAVIIETEIWPELYHQCRKSNVPIYIVNGRLSPKTYRAGFPVRNMYRRALANNATVWARSDVDRERFVAMGCPPENTVAIGSMKMSRKPAQAMPADPVGDQPYHLAVSTHAEEELMLAQASREALGGQLLVVMPRHPQRGESIAQNLKRHGFNVARRSDHDTADASTDVYVADTAGEASDFCAHATWVFVGGSLVDHGGHNIFEPAAWGKAIFVGPHVQNFSEEVSYLKSKEAIIQVSDQSELCRKWRAMRESGTLREKLESATRSAYQSLPDREAEYIDLITAAIDRHHKATH